MGRPKITVNIDFKAVETDIVAGSRVTVRNIAKAQNVSPQVVRRAFTEHYGDAVAFTRGRTGGVVVDGITPVAVVADTSGPEGAD